MKYDYYALEGLQLTEHVFYDIGFLLLEPWRESKKPPKPIVAQRTLYDIRDNNSYTIRKLADGNCWMTSNLKYTLTANSTAIGINHSTNETFTFSTGSVCGGGNTNAACIMNGNTVMTEQVTNGGYYYSWYAATAGTGTASMASGDATGSICPKGWRLPANYSSIPNKSYGSITMAYLGFANNKAENHYVTLGLTPISWFGTGQYYSGAPRYLSAYYWSSTAAPDGYAYNAGFNDSVTHPQEGQLKYMGFPVRCVTR